MSCLTFSEEFTNHVPAKKLFAALILDGDNLIPKLLPQAFSSIETIQGNGGPGTIKKLTFSEGGPVNYVKHRIDGIDKEKMTYSYTVIEDGALLQKFESIAYEIKFEATADGGCKGTNITKFQPKPGTEIKEDEFKDAKEKSQTVFKVVEAYLSANPQAYA